jgi:hypothetical protein
MKMLAAMGHGVGRSFLGADVVGEHAIKKTRQAKPGHPRAAEELVERTSGIRRHSSIIIGFEGM